MKSVSGDVTLDGVRSDITAQTVSGDLETRQLLGTLRFTTVSGDLTVVNGASDAVKAETVSGDLTLDLDPSARRPDRPVQRLGRRHRADARDGRPDRRRQDDERRSTAPSPAPHRAQARQGVAARAGRRRRRPAHAKTVSGDVTLLRGRQGAGMSPVFAHGRLRLYLLKLLDESPRHGYDVIRELEDRFMGLYSPSAGTVYPRLARLEAEGLVTHDVEEGRKVYRITDAGRAELAERQGDLDDLEQEIAGSVRDLATEIRSEVHGSVRDLQAELKAAAKDVRRENRAQAREQRSATQSGRDKHRAEVDTAIETFRCRAARHRARQPAHRRGTSPSCGPAVSARWTRSAGSPTARRPA